MTKSLLFFVAFILSFSVAGANEVPRVLVLGDPIQRNLFSTVAKELKGKAQIVHQPAAAYDTGTALTKIDDLLGEEKWDLIYFNFGLGDLFYKDPRSKEIRAMSKNAGGVRVSSPEHYRKNLEAIVIRLKATKIPLIWSTTTPLVHINSFPGYMGNVYDPNSEIEYNEIAAKIMKTHKVHVNDLHTFILSQFGKDEKHPGHNGYQKALSTSPKGKPAKIPLHQPVVEAILKAIDK